MEKILRTYSQETNPESRNELAAELREQRSKFREHRERRKQAEEAYKHLEQEVETIAGSWKNKLFNFRKLAQLREQLGTANQTLESTPIAEEEDVRSKVAEFYSAERARWENAGYTPEQVQAAFTDEQLQSLTTEEYRTLLHRFDSPLSTHVTRQGIRDHFGMMEHSAYIGEYQSGMKDMLASGHATSTLEQRIVAGELESAASEFVDTNLVQEWQWLRGIKDTAHLSDRELCERWVDLYLGNEAYHARLYGDRMSLHFGRTVVMDHLYGAEGGNECFIIFPEAYLAATRTLEVSGRATYEKQNDLHAFPNNPSEGIPLNSGVVFLPKYAQVDRGTGSKYKIDAEGKGVPRTEVITELARLVSSQEGQAFVATLAKADYLHVIREGGELALEYVQSKSAAECFYSQDFARALADKVERRAQVEESGFAHAYGGLEPFEELAEKALLEAGLLYERTDDPIYAEEYWENYFTTYPQQRPAHLVYYEGDPNRALREWLSSGRITPKSENIAPLNPADFYHESYSKDRLKSASEQGESEYRAAIMEAIEKLPFTENGMLVPEVPQSA